MRGGGGEDLGGKPTTFECILELLLPLILAPRLAPLGSIGPLATAGAISFAVDEVRELNVKGMVMEAARAESAKSGRARARTAAWR